MLYEFLQGVQKHVCVGGSCMAFLYTEKGLCHLATQRLLIDTNNIANHVLNSLSLGRTLR